MNADFGTAAVQALHQAMAAACSALSGNSAQEWAAARSAFAGANASGLGCLDREVFRLVSRLLAAHAANPNTLLRRGAPEPGTACPYSVATIDPSHGPAGADLIITGSALWAVTTVLFGSVAVMVDPAPDGTVSVYVPQLAKAGPVRVQLVSALNTGPLIATAPNPFVFEILSSTTQSPVSTADPSPSVGATSAAPESPSGSPSGSGGESSPSE